MGRQLQKVQVSQPAPFSLSSSRSRLTMIAVTTAALLSSGRLADLAWTLKACADSHHGQQMHLSKISEDENVTRMQAPLKLPPGAASDEMTQSQTISPGTNFRLTS